MQNNPTTQKQTSTKSRAYLLDDIILITIMAVLAGCGLIYEYLLSHYAGRVLGAVESAIYTMIGIMIVSMGAGSFMARKITCAFTGFAWLELFIAIIGASAILVISGAIAFIQLMPQIIADSFNIPPDSLPQGGIIKSLYNLAHYSPYFIGAVLGFFIGMEIPLIARVREQIHRQHLVHNTGTIYGADYIGAGVGAAIWITVMLSLEINLSASITASVNLLAGFVFWLRYRQFINYSNLLFAGHILTSVLVVIIFSYGGQWSKELNNLLYLDKVVYQQQSRFAQIVLTERHINNQATPSYSLYLNGRLQFSANDEHIYHKFLVYPALASSARQNNILIIGGGDGLALREVLKWQPQQVTLVDLDPAVIALFKQPAAVVSPRVADALLKLNRNALNDARVNIIYNDAFNAIDDLLSKNVSFDSIIIDLPDPSHPDLNKLYSQIFYHKLKQLLSADGALVVQSTSPFHAKNAFISIGNTVKAAGWANVEQYHQNVPSFGEWGWTIATPTGIGARARLAQVPMAPFEQWLTPGLIQASFEFSNNFYRNRDKIRVNRLGSFTLYRYHQQAWESQQGLNNSWYQDN